MADSVLTRSRAQSARSRLSPALQIAIVYVVARAVTTVFLLIAAELSGEGSRFGPDATIGSFVMGWDAEWYSFIAGFGYPSDLPRDETGEVTTNQWAFMPLYPVLAKLVGFGNYGLGALIVSLVAGYLSALVLYRLLRDRIDASAAMWAVVFFVSGPLAALFQIGYAEALFLLWLFCALWCVQRRRFAPLYVLIPLMGYTRPGVLAFSLFLALYGIWRWFRRKNDPLPAREVVHIVVLGLWAAAVGFSWQIIAGLVTGDPSGYLETELSWRRSWTGEVGAFVPFDGFVQAAAIWFRLWGLDVVWGYVALGVGVVAVAAALLFVPQVRRLGAEVRLWSASYIVYLLAVFFPQSSLFRLLVPLAPLSGALALPRSLAWRVGVLAACLVGQWMWILNMFALASTYYQIP
ncbi:MAG: hypothetical protein P0Y48_05700 [Candidatus Microbacterium phytovorans]|uniref:Uncharacterized protein n=1 Tax=Candidatus Microbacterium phytovorans TaxID=3121374 RepID=A0AAJ5W2M9_9MICO|nr:hypothetical protein [Microbacterium sp.]WEK14694.1 MAG: hypothetical protein P0Y48_05700 [Microbacterium sp.]